ncbi:MAG TPA: penicillin-binding protein activator [Gammaproteobacteria bacterium]|nr:penicillin-binding protein activator [Gammaproteobacteria bacterium]
MQAIRFKRSFRRLLIVAAIVTLAGCGTHALKPGAGASRSQADALFQSGRYAQAAKQYQQLAGQAKPPARAQLLLRAGEAWGKAGQPEAALKALDAIPANALRGADHTRRVLLSARLKLAAQRPQAALDTLSAAPLPATEQATVLGLRGQALFALDQPVAAVEALTKRAALLQDPVERKANRELIWQGLTRAHQSLAATNLPANLTPTVAGWLALGEIGRTAWQAPYRFGARVFAWQQKYPQHPANGPFLQHLLQTHAQRTSYPGRVALLLPLEGPQAIRAAAIRDGLLAARYSRPGDAAGGNAGSTVIKVYDTHGKPADAVAAYNQAIADGAKAVIGPLDSGALTALVNAGVISVPTLALTDLPDQTDAAQPVAPQNGFAPLFQSAAATTTPNVNPKLYQFGFEATDEARQVAERAVRDGRFRAVALAPDTPRGKKLVSVFAQRLNALGGTLLDQAYFKPGETNVATQIKQILNLNLSHMRAKTLRSVIDRDINFTPRRRQDVQFVFLIADNGEARLIRPQIRFHHGIGLPVYATSRIYEPGSHSEYDLNGVMFTDMPWLLSQDDAVGTVRKEIRQLWPERYAAVTRFYALGYDAWRLVPLIVHLNTPLAQPVRGVTGLLTIGPDHRIHREYDWAIWRHGQIRPLAPVTASQ